MTLTYDAWNRVVQTVGPVGTLDYTYDGLNRMIRRTVEDWADWDFYYNGSWQLLEMTKAVGGGAASTWAQFVWDQRYIDSPVLRDRNTSGDDSVLEQRLFYTTDANFNVTALIEPDGTVAERYEYDAYGQPSILDADFTDDGDGISDVLNEIHFAGYFRSRFNKLYFVRNRVYHPTLGRWLQRDPLNANEAGGGYQDGGNLYEYVASRPVTMTDPMGMKKNTCVRVRIALPKSAGLAREWVDKAGWQLFAILPDPKTFQPGNGPTLGNAQPRASYVRRYVELLQCCDAKNCLETRWSNPIPALGRRTAAVGEELPPDAYKLGVPFPVSFFGVVLEMGSAVSWADPKKRITFRPWRKGPLEIIYPTKKGLAPLLPTGYSFVKKLKCEAKGPYALPTSLPPLPVVKASKVKRIEVGTGIPPAAKNFRPVKADKDAKIIN